MGNTIAIPKKIIKEVDRVSRDLGISNEEFLISAILYYLKSLREREELKKELKAWERISELDLLKFEKKI